MADDIGTIYSKLNKLDERLTAVEATRPYLKEMIERNIASNEKLSDALNDMQGFMQSMNTKIDMQSTAITEIKEDFTKANEQTNAKIAEVNNKIEQVESKTKFDMMDYLRNNLPWIIVVLGFGIAYVSTFVQV